MFAIWTRSYYIVTYVLGIREKEDQCFINCNEARLRTREKYYQEEGSTATVYSKKFVFFFRQKVICNPAAYNFTAEKTVFAFLKMGDTVNKPGNLSLLLVNT